MNDVKIKQEPGINIEHHEQQQQQTQNDTLFENGYQKNLEIMFARHVEGKTGSKAELIVNQDAFHPKLEYACHSTLDKIRDLLRPELRDQFPYNNNFKLHKKICSSKSSDNQNNNHKLIRAYAEYVSFHLMHRFKTYNKKRTLAQMQEQQDDEDVIVSNLIFAISTCWAGVVDPKFVMLIQ